MRISDWSSDVCSSDLDPQLVRVRVALDPDIPILRGTTATVQSSFTGTSTVALDGGEKGQPEITCPKENAVTQCPFNVPVIPTRIGGLGAVLNSAPQLLERLSALTERLTQMPSDKNQASIGGIRENTNRLNEELAERGPEIRATLHTDANAGQQGGRAGR